MCVGLLCTAITFAQQPAAERTTPGKHTKQPWQLVLTDEDKVRVEELEKQITELRGQTRYAEAIPLAEDAFDVRARVQGENHWATGDAGRLATFLEHASTLNPTGQDNLAEADRSSKRIKQLYNEGKYDESLRFARRQLDIRMRLLGEHCSETLDSMHNVTMLLNALGKLGGAEPLFRKVLEGRRKVLGPGHPDTIYSLENLGVLYHGRGELAKAEPIIRQALQARRGVLGEKHSLTLSSANNLAVVLQAEGKLFAAAEVYKEVAEAASEIMGENATGTVIVRNNLASVLEKLGKFGEAERLYRSSIAALRETLGAEHVYTLTALNNLAALLYQHGSLSAAEGLYHQISQSYLVTLGERHPRTQTVMNNLANLLVTQGKVDEAEAVLRRVLETRRQILGDEHADTLSTRNSLASVFEEQSKLDEAEELFRDVLRIQRLVLGDEHPATLASIDNLGGFLRRIGNLAEAEALLLVAINGRRQLLGSNHYLVGRSVCRFASLLAAKGDNETAERTFAQGLEILRESQDVDFHFHATAYGDLVTVELQRPMDAADLYDQAIEHLDRLRLRIAGDELDRSRYFSALLRRDPYAGMARAQLKLGQPSKGLGYLERGRGRAILDVLNRKGQDLYAVALAKAKRLDDEQLRGKVIAIRDAEVDARGRVLSYETQIESAKKDSSYTEEERAERIAELEAKLRKAREDERLAIRRMYDLARSELGSGLQPLDAEQIQALLKKDERLVVYDVGKNDTLLLLVPPKGQEIEGRTLKWPNGKEVDAKSLKATIDRAFSIWSTEATEYDPQLKDAKAYSIEELAAALLPSTIMQDIRKASRLFIVADGPLHRLPFEALRLPHSAIHGSTELAEVNRQSAICLEALPPLVYGPSCTVLLYQRMDKAAKQRPSDAPLLVALGDPIFTREEPQKKAPEKPVPNHGALVVEVIPDTNAAQNGVKEGDVILTYNDTKLEKPADLGAAIQSVVASGASPDVLSTPKTSTGAVDAMESKARGSGQADPTNSEDGGSSGPALHDSASHEARGTSHAAQVRVPIIVWREGKTIELMLESGRIGVRLSQLKMPEALANYRESQLSDDERYVAIARDHSRDQFGSLKPLPGSRSEVHAIAKVVSSGTGGTGTIRLLLGEEATRTKLFQAAQSPKYLHLATHGLAEGGRRVWDSALATTLPRNPTPEDYGFLTLKDLLGNWQGKLEGTELVTLSACRTARGRAEAGEGFVALTWGFMFAGAQSVVATLWNVSDVSTSILMEEFYRNLVKKKMTKDAALKAAKMTLRDLTSEQARKRTPKTMSDEQWRNYLSQTRAIQTDQPVKHEPFDEANYHPYEHPFFWAPFILIGEAD